jgi:hypothetical protein
MYGSSGREVPNQFIITDDDGRDTFQSYTTTIAREGKDGHITLDPRWDCSVTTRRYLAGFLNRSGSGFKRETEQRIADGTYTVANLNPDR